MTGVQTCALPILFERGIDPDVENPEHCHAHSEVPDEWPPLEEILAYQGQVRDRARTLLKDVDFAKDHGVGRALWIGFEHEGTLSSVCMSEYLHFHTHLRYDLRCCLNCLSPPRRFWRLM